MHASKLEIQQAGIRRVRQQHHFFQDRPDAREQPAPFPGVAPVHGCVDDGRDHIPVRRQLPADEFG
jgi:hypothetical protein